MNKHEEKKFKEASPAIKKLIAGIKKLIPTQKDVETIRSLVHLLSMLEDRANWPTWKEAFIRYSRPPMTLGYISYILYVNDKVRELEAKEKAKKKSKTKCKKK